MVMVSLPHSKEKFSGFFTVKKLLLSSREEGQAAKVPARPLTPFRSFTEPSPGSWLRSCMGPVPGQMVKTGKTAKEEANRKWKQGCRCGGEVTQTLSPILPEEARLGGRWGKKIDVAATSKKKEQWSFISPARRRAVEAYTAW